VYDRNRKLHFLYVFHGKRTVRKRMSQIMTGLHSKVHAKNPLSVARLQPLPGARGLESTFSSKLTCSAVICKDEEPSKSQRTKGFPEESHTLDDRNETDFGYIFLPSVSIFVHWTID
jgi:hypothetical protein